jgi:hypothetical protein
MAHGMDHSKHEMHGDHAGHRHEDHAPKHEDLLNAVNNCLDKGTALCLPLLRGL